MLDKQEAFDLAWQEFVVEMSPPAKDSTGSCAYRGKGGSRCHVGLVLPDRLYKRSLEGDCPTSQSFNDIARELDWSAEDRKWLDNFQDMHDVGLIPCDSREKRERLYRDFAKDHRLTVPSEAVNA